VIQVQLIVDYFFVLNPFVIKLSKELLVFLFLLEVSIPKFFKSLVNDFAVKLFSPFASKRFIELLVGEREDFLELFVDDILIVGATEGLIFSVGVREDFLVLEFGINGV
jgi:hypothetical protein